MERNRSVWKEDSERKAFRSEKKVPCKNVARASDFRSTGSEPAFPCSTRPVVCSTVEEGCGEEAGEVGGALDTMQRSEKNEWGKWERNWKAKHTVQTILASRDRDLNQRRNLLACVTGKSRDSTISSRYSFSFSTPTPAFLCWLYSLIGSLHMLASGNSSFTMNEKVAPAVPNSRS